MLLPFKRLGWRRPERGRPLFNLRDLTRGERSANESRIRSLCTTLAVGDETALCRILGRYKLFIDTADFGLSPHLALDGYWEMWLTEVIARTVQPGMTVIDVGANLGYFSMLFADLVGPRGAVHAFEPNPAIAVRLRRSVAVNGFQDRLQVHEQALGDEEGGLFHLIVPPGEPKNAHMQPAAADADGTPGVIRTRRLDSYPELLHAAVVKIDADTAEPAIWRGMRGMLERGHPMTVFLEFNPSRYTDGAGFLAEILGWGFSLSLIDLETGPRPIDTATALAGNGKEDLILMLTR